MDAITTDYKVTVRFAIILTAAIVFMNKAEITAVISKHCLHLQPVSGAWTSEKIKPIRTALKKAEQELKERLDALQLKDNARMLYSGRITDALADKTRYFLCSH